MEQMKENVKEMLRKQMDLLTEQSKKREYAGTVRHDAGNSYGCRIPLYV